MASISPLAASSNYTCLNCKAKIMPDIVVRCQSCRQAIYCDKACRKKHLKSTHNKECRGVEVKAQQVAMSSINSEPELKSASPLLDVVPQDLMRQVLKNQKFSGPNLKEATVDVRDIQKVYKSHYAGKKEYDHTFQTSELILKGAAHLDPEKSIVMIFGLGEAEPIEELLKRARKIYIIDHDQESLDTWRDKLKSPKVVPIKFDLTGSEHLLDSFENEVRELKYSKEDFVKNSLGLLEKIQQEARSASRQYLKLLTDGDSPDFVISSLVASQLGINIKNRIREIYKKHYGEDFETYINDEKCPVEQNSKVAFGNAFENILPLLASRHFNEVVAFKKAESIYIADSISQNFLFKETVYYTLPQLNQLSDTFKRQKANYETRKWTWVEQSLREFPVQAWLMCNKL